MPRLRDLDLDRHLADPALKQRFVTPMFDLIAPRYDDFTRRFSFGMDRRWKRVAVAELVEHAPDSAEVVDLACGTGDLALAAADALPRARVTGIDASEMMVARARARATGPAAVTFEVGDLARLAHADGSFDAATAGYAFRNAPDHRAALREAARVLRPRGVLVTLDFYRPERAAWRHAFLGYLQLAGNLVGWWWHREPVAYGYIAPSIDAFLSDRRFSDDLAAAGFEVLRVHRWLFGGIAVHVARRGG